jgi:MSHA biogenesis protein MshP
MKLQLGQRGFALMMAVFMIVTMAAIGVYLVTVSTAQLAGSTQDEQGARAFQAARTGLEVGAYQILRSSTCTPGPQQVALPQGFFAEVTCVQVNTLGETEGGTVIAVYRVISTGCNTPGCAPSPPRSTYVERQLQITITQ